ncbi:dimethylarginine dimethylaminohydrolase family protein [Alteribacillus iranensis]|uniref:N-Dimethylarginine dimethylaminohydrolase n=1 Tax=Alteribacillus iranensis TaxID=930128 RepID=A0A1I2B5T1_9BACI|nr:arginine deiminase family protein [Alteribacillus iranensis]SFE50520.1 N-Dimethylarginine dimethylaminohydrolase [Alteribacillus iranensis]
MITLQELLAGNKVKARNHNKTLVNHVWDRYWGCTDHVSEVETVLVHRPGEEVLEFQNASYDERFDALFLKGENGEINSYILGDTPPDLELMQKQHDTLTTIYRQHGIDVIELEDSPKLLTNRLFPRDVGMVIPGGVVLSRFALPMRYAEVRNAQKTFAKHEIPILGTIQGKGTMEGGSFIMIDPNTAAVGTSVRVNQEGVQQLRSILAMQDIELIGVDLPSNLIHLDEVFMMVDHKTALADYSKLPHWFIETMKEKEIELIPTDNRDPELTTNCLPIAPGKVIFSTNGTYTMQRLKDHGIEVIEIDISEINKMGGGIHCSTLVLKRKYSAWADMEEE